VYLVVRLLAVIAFLLAVTVIPHGVPAGLVVMAAGIAALLSAVWSNAGAGGERAGARVQDRWFDSVMPPQGDWPPYDAGPPAEPGKGPVLRRGEPRDP
jgi:hypothetical protein